MKEKDRDKQNSKEESRRGKPRKRKKTEGNPSERRYRREEAGKATLVTRVRNPAVLAGDK